MIGEHPHSDQNPCPSKMRVNAGYVNLTCDGNYCLTFLSGSYLSSISNAREAVMHNLLRLASLVATAVLVSAGCGGTQQNCDLKALSVSPSSGTADHAVSSPGNQVQFVAGPVTKGQCAVAACVNCWGQTWTVSDPANVSISNNANDDGTATCLGATNGAVTITATAPVSRKTTQTVDGTATLTCR